MSVVPKTGTGRRLLAAAVLGLIGSGAGVWWWIRERPAPPPKPPPAPKVVPDTLVRQVADPLVPGRPAHVREQPDRSFPGIAAAHAGPSDWARARPARATRNGNGNRSGIDPCNTPDPGFGPFEPWRNVASGWFTLPRQGVPGPDGSFDLLLHFHGHELARKDFVRASVPFVLFGSSAGNYRNRLSGQQALTQTVALVEKLVNNRADRSAHARHVVLAAWSGGYEAVGVLLEQSSAKPDAVVLLDGLHFSRDPRISVRQMEPFLSFARRAAAKQAFMFISHSSIDTDGFASSTESSHQLVAALGGRPLRVQRDDGLGLELIEMFSKGDLHVRGYAGSEKPDHCAHLSLYPMVLQSLARRWATR